MNPVKARPFMTPAQVRDMTKLDVRSVSPETRLVLLELQHAIAAIERASLIARNSEAQNFMPDLMRLLETSRDTLNLIKGPSDASR